MIGTLGSFVAELRAVGLPVSTAEAIDAAEALRHIDPGSEAALREALAATLVKAPRHRRPFDIAFDVFFGTVASPAGGQEGDDTADDLAGELAAALREGNEALLQQGASRAVSALAGFQSGRPVGGRYYLYRVLQRLEGIEELLIDEADDDGLNERIASDTRDARMARLREALRREIIRRLVADRGAGPVARTLRETLVEDIDLTHATSEELARIEQAVGPLARKLATRLSQRRRHIGRNRLDLRRTIRASLAHGGALIDPRFQKPRRTKPEIVLLCDLSGSMATFSRFTLQLTYAVSSQFSRVRTFAFVDGVDEVTRFFNPRWGFQQGLARLSREARIVAYDGHSDYGAVFRAFSDRFGSAVTPQTTLIVTGDARTNYREPAIDQFAGLADRARATFWLNPEAKRFWDTGDSAMSRYTPWCAEVFEVRNLRQLEHFVEQVALGRQRKRLAIT